MRMKANSMIFRKSVPARTPAVALMILLTGGWVGCSGSKLQGNDESEEELAVTDADVTRAITAEFWTDDTVDANSVDVETHEGVVTLTGTVRSILAKERAAKIAEATVGVRAIINQLTVRPAVSRKDSVVEQAVRRSLAVDPATDSYEVLVTVEDGVVTLTGSVDSWQEKQLCSTVAKSVTGVTGVQNDIEVQLEADRPDDEIEAEVEARLANDVVVDDYLIEVGVEDREVKLTGTVGSLAEKNRARYDAWVGGVESVDVDGLEVEWWARERMKRASLYQSRPDDEIRQAVEDAFIYDPRVLAFEPEVRVDNGTVTLTGVVDNLKAKRAAEQDALNVIGVRRVKNYLRVRPAVAVANEELETRVEQALLADPYLEQWKIDVEAFYGTVYLSGDVHTSFEKSRAEKVAEGVAGATSVVNNLDYQHLWTWKPDWEIRQDVNDQLYWSIHVDEDNVGVEVEEGIVTLTGQVDSWSERKAAETNAFQAGAKDVRNLLSVEYEAMAASPAG